MIPGAAPDDLELIAAVLAFELRRSTFMTATERDQIKQKDDIEDPKYDDEKSGNNPYQISMNGADWWNWFREEKVQLNHQIINHCNKIGKSLEGRDKSMDQWIHKNDLRFVGENN